jgi:hypothetical protein
MWAPVSGTRAIGSEADASTGGAVGGGAPPDAEAPGAQGVAEGNPLLGSWHHEVGTCSYTHSFDESGRYTIGATTGEAIEATYRVSAPATDGGRWQLAFTITSDNNVVDCEGDQIDETGSSRTAFIDVINVGLLDIYASTSGGSPSFSLRRL